MTLAIEEQIEFIKKLHREDASAINSDYYQAVLNTLMQTKERMDERTISRFDIFIDPAITRMLLDDGLIRGDYHDPYSGTKEQVIWRKYVGTDQYNQHHTVCITKNEIGVEVEYDYGGGQSGGYWEFTEDDPESFRKAYGHVVESIKKKQLTPPKS